MRIEQTFTIARPPQDVFDFMIEPGNLGKWQTIHTSCVPLVDGPPRRGYRVREGAKVGPRRWEQITEFTEFEPGRLLGVKVVDGPPSWGRWRLEPVGAGTRAHFEAEFKAPRALGALLRPLAQRQWRRFHDNLRRHVEG